MKTSWLRASSGSGRASSCRELKELYLLRDGSFESRGIAFCRFETNSETNAALTAKFKLKGQLVTVQRATNPEQPRRPQQQQRKSLSSSSSSSSSSPRSSSVEPSEAESSRSSPHPPGPTCTTILVGVRRVTISLLEKSTPG